MKKELIRCAKCGKILNPKKMVTLEYDLRTGKFVDPNKVQVPERESQGCWDFGPDCAKDPEFGDWLMDGLGNRK
jgi:phage FluMu protein Com